MNERDISRINPGAQGVLAITGETARQRLGTEAHEPHRFPR
jgi:hypothetical protein